MILYRIEYGYSEKGRDLIGVEWRGTQLDAKNRKKELMDGIAYDIETTQVDVPTDKAGLLRFLNENIKGDL